MAHSSDPESDLESRSDSDSAASDNSDNLLDEIIEWQSSLDPRSGLPVPLVVSSY